MTGVQFGLVLAGVAVLFLVLYDVFATVLHHWGSSGPLGHKVVRWLWSTAVRLTRGWSRERRRGFLGRVGPGMIPLTVALWAGLAVVGFALVYFPWMPSGYHAGESIPSLRSFTDAVYYSGVTFFTLGYGDITPLAASLRMVAIVEAGSGFALITLVISYFTSVYGAYSQQKVTAESVFYQADRSPDAAKLIAQHLTGGGPVSTFSLELARLREGLAAIRSSYVNYPVLHYFIAPHPEQSLLRLLFVVRDLCSLLDTALDSRERPEVAGLGRRSGLLHAVDEAQSSLADTLLRQAPSDIAGNPAPGPRAGWPDRFERARCTLRRSGIPVREDEAAIAEYCRRRGEWEPVLRASARELGEDWAEIAGGF